MRGSEGARGWQHPPATRPDAPRRQQRAADAIRRSLGAKRLTTSEFTCQNLFMIPIGLMPRFAGDPQRVEGSEKVYF